MKRPDADQIRLISKAMKQRGGLVTPEFIREAVRLPYFYFHDKYAHEYSFADQSTVIDEEEFSDLHDELLYDEFVMSVRTVSTFQETNKDVDTQAWCVFKRLENRRLAVVIGVSMHLPHPIVHMWTGHADLNAPAQVFRSLECTKMYQKITEERGLQHKKNLEGTLSAEMDRFAIFCVKFMGLLTMHMKYGDKHPVEVAPVNPPKANPVMQRDRPWSGPSGPRVLLLDRMPTTQTQGTGTHASPKPHRRRGHWKTLSHPRFRHHPQYQQKIYVKPSFVGPRQVTYEGNIYRLVQPLEELNV